MLLLRRSANRTSSFDSSAWTRGLPSPLTLWMNFGGRSVQCSIDECVKANEFKERYPGDVDGCYLSSSVSIADCWTLTKLSRK